MKTIKPHQTKLTIAIATVLLAITPVYAGTDGNHEHHGFKPQHDNHGVLNDRKSDRHESKSMWQGATREEWTQRWWKWAMSIPYNVSLWKDTYGTQCGINQSGSVWFIGAPLGGNVTRSCTMPKGKAVLVPIVDAINDYPCPDPSFEPATGQTLENYLQIGAVQNINTFTNLSFTISPLSPFKKQRVTTDLFSFTAAADLQKEVDPCVTGSPQLGVSDGHFVFIEPLKVGHYVLHFHSEAPGYGTTDGDFELNVVE